MFELEKIKSWLASQSQSIKANKKIAYHTSILFASAIIVSLFGLITKGIQTRALTPEDYGLYAFFTTLTGFSVIFFHVGLFPTVEFILASNHDQERERELFGASIILAFFIGIFYALFLLVLSFFIDVWFHLEFGYILRLVVPLCFIFPLRLLISFIAIGANKVTYSAWFDILVQVLFSILLAFCFYYSDLSLIKILYISLGVSLISLIVVLFLFKPSFKNFNRRFSEIKAKNKEYGLHVYIASIFTEISYRADEFLITYFISATLLGYYSLANIICSPMVVLSVSASSSLFKKLANDKIIHPKIFAFNYAWIVISFVILYLFADKVVVILLGNNFLDVSKYIMPLAVVYIFKTLQQPYAFLTAKGLGKEIKNIAFAEGLVSVVANVICIPIWGVMGAVYAGALARLIGFLGRRYYYQKYLNANNL